VNDPLRPAGIIPTGWRIYIPHAQRQGRRPPIFVYRGRPSGSQEIHSSGPVFPLISRVIHRQLKFGTYEIKKSPACCAELNSWLWVVGYGLWVMVVGFELWVTRTSKTA